MNVHQALVTRRTIKSFQADPVDRARIEEWLQFAAHAPNHRMTEPWEVCFIGPQTRQLLQHKTDFGGAPVLLAILSRPGQTPLARDEHLAATACFIQNFLLAAHADGYGVGWSSLGASARVRDLLGVEQGTEIVALLPVGRPATIPSLKARTPITAKIHDLP